MAQHSSTRSGRSRRFTLSLRLSLLLLLAAVLPLVITVTSDDLLARSRLIDQGTKALQTDAQNKVDLINAYLSERLFDAETLANIETTQVFFADIVAGRRSTADELVHAGVALGAGEFRDKDYSNWSYVDMRGRVRLSTDQSQMAPGAVKIPAPELQAEQGGHAYLSPIFFDPESRQGLIYIDVPVALQTGQPPAGFVRATLKITHIWDIVANDKDANGDGSGAFILDENGVRIADTNADERFTAVAPLPDNVQAEISTESRYGAAASVNVDPLPEAASTIKSSASAALFQAPATAGGSPLYQFVGERLSIVPWMYFVLSPLPTVTSVADTQIKISALIAAIVATLAAFVGLLVGRSTARPVLASVNELRSTTTSLNALGAQQESAASEQLWMVDACQAGVEHITYLANATSVAASQMIRTGNILSQQWDQLSPDEITRAVTLLIKLAHYIEQASQEQQKSSDRLSTAVKVTNQVSDQLASSAESAGKYANQLERVVEQLQRLVGMQQGERLPAGDDQPARL
jgi:hypothetical protein